jgi:hypothetical protein
MKEWEDGTGDEVRGASVLSVDREEEDEDAWL